MKTGKAKVIPFPSRPARDARPDAASNERDIPSLYDQLPEAYRRELLTELAAEFLRTGEPASADPERADRRRD